MRYIISTEDIKARAIAAIRALPLDPVQEINIKEYKKNRNLEQNKKMWAMLTDISNQVIWHGQKLTRENWKDVLTASLKQQKVVPGIDSGFVVLGSHTSKMSIAEMSELIELALAFGTQNNVRWTAPEEY
jgi:NinB protein